MSNVFVTRAIPEEGIELMKEAGHEVEVFGEDRVMTREELLEGVKGRDAVLCLLTDTIDDEVLAQAGEQCKIFANYAVGYNNIDVEAATKHNIVIANTPGVLTDAVAEHTIAMMLAIARRIPEADRYVRAGNYKGWGPQLLMGPQIKGKTLGVVGLGRIGSTVAERAHKGLEMSILYTDLKPNEDFEKTVDATYVKELDEMLPQCDFVTVHVPLLEATRHLMNAARFQLMKNTALLVNTSRGSVLDEAALVEALKSGEIAGAAIDVFEDEPALKPGMIDLENVVLTPHIASATKEARGAMSRLAGQAIVDVLAGKEPENIVKLKE